MDQKSVTRCHQFSPGLVIGRWFLVTQEDAFG